MKARLAVISVLAALGAVSAPADAKGCAIGKHRANKAARREEAGRRDQVANSAAGHATGAPARHD